MAELEKPVALDLRGGVWFALAGSQQLHIGVDSEFTAARKAHPALRLTDATALGKLAERLGEAGFPVGWDAEVPGLRRFYTEDPWGNRLELLAPAA